MTTTTAPMTTAPMTVAALAVQEQLIHDPDVQLWCAVIRDDSGEIHRRWFATRKGARKWLDSQRAK